jgi:hypothetical protein
VGNEGDDIKYTIQTLPDKLVCDYARISFFDLEDLPVDEFKFLLREAFIYKMNQTEAGREYLEKCWILEQTTPDRKKLRERFS